MIGHGLGQRLGHAIGHLLGQHEDAMLGAGASVTIPGVGAVVTSSSTTTLSLSKAGTNMKVGDLILIFQLAFNTPTTPTGYTLLATANSGSFVQTLYVWGKTCATGGETTTAVGIGQASSNILQGVIVALRGAKATPVLDVSSLGSAFQSTVNPQPMQAATAASKGLAIALCCPTSATGTPTYTPSSGWSNPLAAAFDSRFGMGVRNVTAGQALSGTILSSAFANGVSVNWDKATLTFK